MDRQGFPKVPLIVTDSTAITLVPSAMLSRRGVWQLSATVGSESLAMSLGILPRGDHEQQTGFHVDSF